MNPILHTLQIGLPVLLTQLGVTLVLLGVGSACYIAVTPFQEMRLIRAGNTAAGIVLAGTLVALAIPLATTLATSLVTLDILLWGLVALVIQLLTFIVAATLIRGLRAHDRGRQHRRRLAAGRHPARRGAAQRRRDGRLAHRRSTQEETTMLSFIRNLVGVKTDQAVNGAIEAIVRWDPQSATEAELRTMEQYLDQLGRQVAQARMSFDKEKKEADAIQQLSQQRMAAAEQLNHQVESETNPARKSDLERSLAKLLGLLEQMAADIDREKQDAEDARSFLESLEQTYNQAGQKLKAARDDLNRAHRDMGRAAQQREMAEQRAQAARQAAGLSGATSGLSVALKAMQDSAARDLAAAEAAASKAKLLQPTSPEKDDPNISAAMAKVSGALPATASLTDRLQAIRQRQASPRQLSGPAVG